MNSMGRHSYFAFGLRLSSNIPLHWLGPECAAGEQPGVLIDCFDLHEASMDVQRGELLYESKLQFGGIPYYVLHRTDRGDMFSYCDDVHILLESNRITAYTTEKERYRILQSRLLSSAIAYWLEQRGVTMLHASSIKVGEGAVGFLADSGMGKSTMAANFVARGNEMLGDDLLACRVVEQHAEVLPMFPSLRLYSAQVERFFGATDGIETVQPYEDKLRLDVGAHGYGRFCGITQKLSCLYFLERVHDAERLVEILPVAPAAAIRNLTYHSFIAPLARAMGMTALRFSALGEIANCVPVRRIVYRSGFENLEAVYDALSQDVERVAIARSINHG